MLPDRLNAKWWAPGCSETTSPVPRKARDIVEQTIRISSRLFSCLQNASKLNYEEVQISELLGVLARSPRLFCSTSNLEPYSAQVIFLMFISICTIRLTIFLLHTLSQECKFDAQSSRYSNPQDYLQAICYRFYLMQNSLAPNVQVQQLLQQVQYASYLAVWPPGWTCRHNQPNHVDWSTLLESPLPNPEGEEVLSIVELSSTRWKRSILLFWWADTPEIRESGLLVFSWSINEEKEELGLGMWYQGHWPYIRLRCYEIQAWSPGWYWYILPCNQVLDTKQI